MNPGEIHWVELPPGPGHEQVGRRPAIVLQDDAVAGDLPLAIVVPLTASGAALRFYGTFLLESTDENGLAKDSVVLVFQIRAVDRGIIRERIGTVGPETLATIHTMLDRLMSRMTVNQP